MAEVNNQRTFNLEASDMEELNNTFRSVGVAGYREKARQIVDRWRGTEIRIAFIGQSGSGKSSLINAILGLMADDPGAAETGETETTMEPKSYTHPRHDNIVFVDLPGCGTENFPLESYLEKIDFGSYDFFILVNHTRFLKDDIELAKQLSLHMRTPYFVRTKVGQDIENFKRSHRNHDEDAVGQRLQKIRDYCFEQIIRFEWPNGITPPQFLVDSYDLDKYDFGLLVSSMVQHAPEKKRESFVLGLDGIYVMGETLINEKEKYLKRRIWRMSLLSAVGSAVPVPGIGEAVDIHLLKKESEFFRQQLGLDEKSLNAVYHLLAAKFDVHDVEGLKNNIVTCTNFAVLDFLASSATSNTAENIAKYGIPIAGLAFSASLSYGATVWGLRQILKRMVESARNINRMLRESAL